MAFTFPEYPEPTPIDGERSWTARFDSYDQRNDDIYYEVTIHQGASQVARFYVKVFPAWAGDDWNRPDFADKLRQDIHKIAATGKSNTDYLGPLVPRRR